MRRAGTLVCFAAAALIGAATAARAQTPVSARPPAGESSFRLGTAAWPFAWSTAVGDVNADGRPDYAIADRVGRAGGRFAYALELSVAGVPAQWVTFDAADAALTVSLRDVDDDRDLDVVVSALFSRAIVSVWLNDGRGRFHEVSSWPSTAERRPGEPQLDRDAPSVPDTALSVPRRTVAGATTDGAPIPEHLPARDFRVRTPRHLSQLVTSRVRSRAPPLA